MTKGTDNRISYEQRCLIEELVKSSLTPLIEAVLTKRLCQMAQFLTEELTAPAPKTNE